MALRYEGCTQFRQRIVASTLSQKILKIEKIRDQDDSPGLHDFEASFLRLIEKITDGCSIEINETGTTLRYKPGLITGGKLTHDCGTSRAIGWFIEVLLSDNHCAFTCNPSCLRTIPTAGIIPLAVFAKESLSVVFTGITNDSVDLSVDILRYVTLPFLKNFGVGDASLTIKKRGAAPLGGGSIEFNCPIVRQLVPIHITDVGLIKRVRGVVFSARISPTIITRVVDSARGVLNNLLPDVYIHADHYKGAEGGKSPGYSLSLVAESTTGVLLSIERTAGEADCGGAGQGGRPESPELLGEEGAYRLLDEIRKGGVVDTSHQSLVLQLMVVCPEDVCKVRFGELTDQSIRTLRLLRDAFGVTFKIKEESPLEAVATDKKRGSGVSPTEGPEVTLGKSVYLSCLGTGYINMSRRIK